MDVEGRTRIDKWKIDDIDFLEIEYSKNETTSSFIVNIFGLCPYTFCERYIICFNDCNSTSLSYFVYDSNVY